MAQQPAAAAALWCYLVATSHPLLLTPPTARTREPLASVVTVSQAEECRSTWRDGHNEDPAGNHVLDFCLENRTRAEGVATEAARRCQPQAFLADHARQAIPRPRTFLIVCCCAPSSPTARRISLTGCQVRLGEETISPDSLEPLDLRPHQVALFRESDQKVKACGS